MGGGGGRGGWFGGEGGASFVLVYVFLVLWDYVVGLRSWAWDLFLSGTFGLGLGWVWVGLGCLMFPSLQMIGFWNERTERLRCYLDTGKREERRGEVR